jgi:hypothetical protein
MLTGIREYSFRCLKQDDVVAGLKDKSISYSKNEVYISNTGCLKNKDDVQHNGGMQASV